ncbi:MAG: heme ABC exporter ATP-binding protein CcmA [Hyphomicrobiaceae bacterium]|nr:heme ABC exporter ATP-binding protein CcmA [Hyphomicrobiaceae bacterium]
MSIILKIDNLIVKRSERYILTGVGLRIASGTAFIITGPNGVGKTTLLRAIAGYVPLLSGSIVIEGGDPEFEVSEYLHYIGHNNAIKLALTVRENLNFWAGFLESNNKLCHNCAHLGEPETVEGALERFQLHELAELPVAYLSAGQKRRVALSRLLIAPRPIWLLDEPTVALDSSNVKVLTDIANAHLRNGGLILAATHFPLLFEISYELELSWPNRYMEDEIMLGDI